MANELITILLGIGAISSAVLALEIDNNTHAVISLWLSTVFTGLLFFIFGAYYAAVLQFIVYSGVLAILFLSFVGLSDQQAETGTDRDKSPLRYEDVIFGGKN